MNFVPDDLAQISDEELAVALEDNLNRWTKNYHSFITMPINEQNPVFEQTTKIAAGNVGEYFDFVEYKFEFDETTFYLEGSGKTHYRSRKLANGDKSSTLDSIFTISIYVCW